MKKDAVVDEVYETIRNTPNDIEKIAKNADMPDWKVNRIKNHVLNNEHILDDGIRKFDPDVEIADSWKRLTDGNHNQNDLDLLNHEYYESRFEEFFKTDYRAAHNKTVETGRYWDPYKELD